MAVGFKNGGGGDDYSRAEIKKKFRDDLKHAREERPDLPGFVFFTNVDLPPADKDELLAQTQGRGVRVIDIFDLERLRHVLDSPEGLIPRLQYLNIPMNATEQVALVSKFGNQLQHAVTARFDRVEQTLSQMQRFLDLQKPLSQLDAYTRLNQDITSREIGDEAILLKLEGFFGIDTTLFWLLVNQPDHDWLESYRVVRGYHWDAGESDAVADLHHSPCSTPRYIISLRDLSITKVGHPLRMIDWNRLELKAYCTEGIRPLIDHIAVDINGYELFSSAADGALNASWLTWPKQLPYAAGARTWKCLFDSTKRRIMAVELPERSARWETRRHA